MGIKVAIAGYIDGRCKDGVFYKFVVYALYKLSFEQQIAEMLAINSVVSLIDLAKENDAKLVSRTPQYIDIEDNGISANFDMLFKNEECLNAFISHLKEGNIL